MDMKDRCLFVKENVKRICEQSNRNFEDVKIIAVTKTFPVEPINEVINLGFFDIGENRVQEIVEKYDFLDERKRVHLIGQLQINKVKYILDKVELIHSLDRISLAEQIEKLASKNNLAPINVLVEVNIAGETTKSGILPNKLTEYLDILANFRYINPIGLMTVAPIDATEDEQNLYFEKMRLLLPQGQAVFGDKFKELSMGMSRDYEAAIRQGATMIRLGTAILGKRNYNI